MIVTEVSGFDARVQPGALAVDEAHADEIAASWAQATARNPALFNGPVLLSDGSEVRDGRLYARYRRTRYATFMWLKQRDYEGWPIRNVFGAAVVVSADGAVLLGRMAPHTSNAGQLYFPCGTPDPDDLVGDVVDLEGSILREMAEETGLFGTAVRASDRRLVVETGSLVACLRRFESDLDAATLAARCAAHLDSEARPELDRIVLVQDAAELTDMSPDYVHAAVRRLI